jgi:hypothetical protein
MKKDLPGMTGEQLRRFIGRPVGEVLGHNCHTFYPLVNSEGIIIDVVSIDEDMDGLELIDDTYLITQYDEQ